MAGSSSVPKIKIAQDGEEYVGHSSKGYRGSGQTIGGLHASGSDIPSAALSRGACCSMGCMSWAARRCLVLTTAAALLSGGALGVYVGYLQRQTEALVGANRLRLSELLEKLHRLEREEVLLDAQARGPCLRPLAEAELADLLVSVLGRQPSPSEHARFQETAAHLHVCQVETVRALHADSQTIAATEAAFRVITGRPGEPVRRFSYLVWLSSGQSIEAVARDLAPLAQPALTDDALVALHRADLEEVARRTRTLEECTQGLPRADTTSFLEAQLGYTPITGDVDLFLSKARELRVCNAQDVRALFGNRVAMTVVDVIFRIRLGRPPDPLGRLIYGVWLSRGVGVDQVTRDVMTSPEYQTLRRIGGQ